MFELKKLNVHRIVATEEEKNKLIAIGYEEVDREERKKSSKRGKA